jgi:hypothetical protein
MCLMGTLFTIYSHAQSHMEHHGNLNASRDAINWYHVDHVQERYDCLKRNK